MAGMGLFTSPENGWEIHWLLFKFPNHLHKGTIVYELIISLVGILFYYLKYLVNLIFHSFPLIYQIKNLFENEKFVRNLSYGN